ncbi:TetR/AcrR family transcriptional regulator [Streptosporangium sp. CA-115845]|uniref:TetR/AcrR family transcriptional regulator n=1 Tax=Streptosporangium sp. CA-115845 TaxID=3240071 RepID=UPI003D8B71EF
MSAPGEKRRGKLRRDAELNRRKIIAAAHEVFREQGVRATLDDVAERAGVGVGTVYRRFANKEELVDALFEDMIDNVEAMLHEATLGKDAWSALTSALEKVCELQAFDRGLREVMLGTGRGPQRRDQVLSRIAPAAGDLLQRAKDEGALRPDVQPWDMPMIQLMVAAISEHTGHPNLWRRYLRLILDGLRTRPDTGADLPNPITDELQLLVALDDASALPAQLRDRPDRRSGGAS